MMSQYLKTLRYTGACELSLDYSEHNRTVAGSAFRTVKLNSVPGNESYYSGRRPCRIVLLPYESSPTFILYGTGTYENGLEL
jgi:hypothetical protein